jgi:hypothetical protein
MRQKTKAIKPVSNKSVLIQVKLSQQANRNVELYSILHDINDKRKTINLLLEKINPNNKVRQK